jgi:catechol 2,3-dioxygenase-like lactoylglutathione lyase family enzyme
MKGRGSTWWGVVLEAPDARELAEFYAGLLGWPIAKDEPGWVVIAVPGTTSYVGFQTSADFAPPVWPSEPGRQQMMSHLDIEVDDLPAAVADAVEHGARLAEHQPQEDVRVLLDPVGHPFCLYLGS